MIRFIDREDADCITRPARHHRTERQRDEYQEVIAKVYVPDFIETVRVEDGCPISGLDCTFGTGGAYRRHMFGSDTARGCRPACAMCPARRGGVAKLRFVYDEHASMT
jgi:hypothetical protein